MWFFFSSTDARCRAPVLRKNCPSKMTTTTTMTKTIWRSAQRSLMQKISEPKTTTNARFHAFAVVAAIVKTSRAHAQAHLASLECFETACILGCGRAQWRWFSGLTGTLTHLMHYLTLRLTLYLLPYQGRMGNCKVTGILERPAPA